MRTPVNEPGPRPTKKAAHVRHRFPRVRKDGVNRLDKLDICLPAAQVITRRKQLDTRARGRVVKNTSGVHHATEHASMSVDVSIATINVRKSSNFIGSILPCRTSQIKTQEPGPSDRAACREQRGVEPLDLWRASRYRQAPATAASIAPASATARTP